MKRVSNAAGPPVGAIKVAEIAKEGGVWIRVQASHRAEVRALLAPPPGCRVQPRASDDLRALCGQRHRTGRISDSSYERATTVPIARERHSLAVDRAAGHRARPADQAVDRARPWRCGDTRPRAAGAQHRPHATTPAPRSASSRTRAAGSAGCSRCWPSASRSRWCSGCAGSRSRRRRCWRRASR